MKFGQLIEYNMRKIFLEKPYKKCGGETIPRLFSKKSNWACLWINPVKFYTVCFYCMRIEDYRSILKLSCRSLALTSYKVLKKPKCCLPHFYQDFWRKMFLLLHFINWPNFIAWLLLLREVLTNMCIVIVWWPDCDVINFEINLIFLV